MSLKILSFNLGNRYILVNRREKDYVTDFILNQDCDIVMLQGNNLRKRVNLRDIDYNITHLDNRTLSLCKKKFPILGEYSLENGTFSSFVTYYNSEPVNCINVNSCDLKEMNEVDRMFRVYLDPRSDYYLKNAIVTGRLPRELDTNSFCDNYDLDDLSTRVGINYYEKTNKEMVEHLFVSRKLNCDSIYKHIGVVDNSNMGKGYPIEACLTYKKTR